MSVKCDIIKCRQPVVLPFAPAILRCTYVPPKPVAIRNRNSFSDPQGFFYSFMYYQEPIIGRNGFFFLY